LNRQRITRTVYRVFIKEGFRNLGIGTKLTKALVEIASKEKVQTWRIHRQNYHDPFLKAIMVMPRAEFCIRLDAVLTTAPYELRFKR